MNVDSAYGTDGSGRRATASGDHSTVRFPSSSTRTAHIPKSHKAEETPLCHGMKDLSQFSQERFILLASPLSRISHLLAPTHPVVNSPAHADHHPSRHCHCHWRDSLRSGSGVAADRHRKWPFTTLGVEKEKEKEEAMKLSRKKTTPLQFRLLIPLRQIAFQSN